MWEWGFPEKRFRFNKEFPENIFPEQRLKENMFRWRIGSHDYWDSLYLEFRI